MIYDKACPESKDTSQHLSHEGNFLDGKGNTAVSFSQCLFLIFTRRIDFA